jgi:hypothetical protein
MGLTRSAVGVRYSGGFDSLMMAERDIYSRRLAGLWREDTTKVAAMATALTEKGRSDLAYEGSPFVAGAFPRLAFWLWNRMGAAVAAHRVRGPRINARLGARVNADTYAALRGIDQSTFLAECRDYLALSESREPVDVAPWWWNHPTYPSYPPRRFYFEDGKPGDAEPGWRPGIT